LPTEPDSSSPIPQLSKSSYKQAEETLFYSIQKFYSESRDLALRLPLLVIVTPESEDSLSALGHSFFGQLETSLCQKLLSYNEIHVICALKDLVGIPNSEGVVPPLYPFYHGAERSISTPYYNSDADQLLHSPYSLDACSALCTLMLRDLHRLTVSPTYVLLWNAVAVVQ
jgi:hypothetical protein